MDFTCLLANFLLLIIAVRLGFAFVGGVFLPYVFAPLLGLTQNLKDLAGGKWAVVTGATDGIGQAYAAELAKRGFNILLVSRTQEKLDSTASDIREKYGVEVRSVAFDFTESNADAYTKAFGKLAEELDIGVLVNNVGVSFEYPEVLHMLPGGIEAARNMPIVNCLSVTLMVTRNKGVIVNVASASAYNPTPFLGIYSASKVFVDYLTKTLQLEYQNTGLTFQCVLPFFVKTKMSGLKRATFFTPDAENFARSAVKTIGLVGSTPGCFSHALQRAVFTFVPTVLIEKYMMNLMKNARARSLHIRKKREMQQQE